MLHRYSGPVRPHAARSGNAGLHWERPKIKSLQYLDIDLLRRLQAISIGHVSTHEAKYTTFIICW